MDWAIYYDNDTVYYSEDGPWNAAPVEGVLAVAEQTGEKFTVHSGGDFYYLIENDNTVVSTDDAATILRGIGLPGRTEYGCLKFGRFTSNSKMAKLFDRIRYEWVERKL